MPTAILVHNAFAQNSIRFELVVLRAEKAEIGHVMGAAVCYVDDVIDMQSPGLAAASAACSGPKPRRRKVRHTSSWCARNIFSNLLRRAASSSGLGSTSRREALAITITLPCRGGPRRSLKDDADAQAG